MWLAAPVNWDTVDVEGLVGEPVAPYQTELVTLAGPAGEPVPVESLTLLGFTAVLIEAGGAAGEAGGTTAEAGADGAAGETGLPPAGDDGTTGEPEVAWLGEPGAAGTPPAGEDGAEVALTVAVEVIKMVERDAEVKTVVLPWLPVTVMPTGQVVIEV